MGPFVVRVLSYRSNHDSRPLAGPQVMFGSVRNVLCLYGG